jgi:predicted metal-dependent HD superfamily phosphohydrolase
MMLEETFKLLIARYDQKAKTAEALWNEISQHYSRSDRHYHTLTHLRNLLDQLCPHQATINDWDAVLFALYYHDIVYNVTKKDNEERSAELAMARLTTLQVPPIRIEATAKHIHATKGHQLIHDNNDTNIFTDADLSILGADWEAYKTYCRQIRSEYAIYHDLLYNAGRKQVLQHFLEMDQIYKTDSFRPLEHQARLNMTREIRDVLL